MGPFHFELTLADLEAYRRWWSRDRAGRRILLLDLIAVPFAGMVFTLALTAGDDATTRAWMLAAVFVLGIAGGFGAFVLTGRALVQRTAKMGMLGRTVVWGEPHGVAEQSQMGVTVMYWAGIERVEDGPAHVFIVYTHARGVLILPRRADPSGVAAYAGWARSNLTSPAAAGTASV